MTNHYTNAELGSFLVRIGPKYKPGSTESYHRARDILLAYPTSLAEYYAQKGSLRGINIPKIGKVTLGLLELILERGFEEADKARDANQIAEMLGRQRIGQTERNLIREYVQEIKEEG